MKTVKLAMLALLSAAGWMFMRDARSIVPVETVASEPASPFNWKESAALFVGIRQFTGEGTPVPVPYAVDDAVDLAAAFALDPRVQLVPAEKVVLALSGEPVKEESKQRLADLIAAGAKISAATRENVLQMLESQTDSVGSGGMLIVSFATHGFITEGEPYVLGAASTFGQPETALSALTIFDIASRARRSLILMDACRERVPDGARAASADVLDAAPLIRRRTNVTGQAVLYAAPAGKFAYDDSASRNGIFTKKVLEALDCKARKVRQAVTVETLAKYVDREVLEWVKKNRDDRAENGIQLIFDGKTGLMPLAICGKVRQPGGPHGPVTVRIAQSAISAFDKEGKSLWTRSLDAPVVHAVAADLDGDNVNEVIAATRDRIVAIDRAGVNRWTTPVSAPLRTFATGSVLRGKNLEIVAILRGASESRLAVYRHDGTLHTELAHEGELQQLLIDRPTSHHGWKIIVTAAETGVLHSNRTTGTAFLLTEGCLKSGKPEWYGAVLPHERIDKIETVDFDNDARRDIVLHTPTGRVYLTFEGKVAKPEGVQFVPIAQSTRAHPVTTARTLPPGH